MTQPEYDAFVGEFQRLSSALARYKQSPQEAAAKADAYYHALKHLPFAEVVAKADTWLRTESRFPSPAQWGAVVIRQRPDYPVLSVRQAQELRTAERQGYEAGPCGCPSCVEAGVSEKPLRYVPDEDGEGVRRAIDGNRLVTPGHWAHGWALARWYQARGDFYNRCLEFGMRRDVLRPVAGESGGTLTRVGR